MVPPIYLEELFVSTPQEGDAFSHVITGIARQAGLRSMVEMACQMASGGDMQLVDRYHTGVRRYLGSLDQHKPVINPLPAEMRSHISLKVTNIESGIPTANVASLATNVHVYYEMVNNARSDLQESSAILLETIALAKMALENSGNPAAQQLLSEAVVGYDRVRNAVLYIGKVLIHFDAYVRTIT